MLLEHIWARHRQAKEYTGLENYPPILYPDENKDENCFESKTTTIGNEQRYFFYLKYFNYFVLIFNFQPLLRFEAVARLREFQAFVLAK